MAPEYQVASLWIGGALGPVERICLESFLRVGQHVILFTYGAVSGVPEGVEIRDAGQILPARPMIRHDQPGSPRHGSPAPHADRFRYLMLARMERTIWVDTDAYCLRPLQPLDGHLHAIEDEARGRVANGVLALPRDSEALARLIELTAQPPRDLPWGAWGPRALTRALRQSGEIRHAARREVLYPVPYRQRHALLQRGQRLRQWLSGDSVSVHLYGSWMRARLAALPDGRPRRGSIMGRLMARHGLYPEAGA